MAFIYLILSIIITFIIVGFVGGSFMLLIRVLSIRDFKKNGDFKK